MPPNNLPALFTAPTDVASAHAFADLDSPDVGDGPDWHRILSALQRFKWLILSITLLGTAAGIAATRYVQPAYLAQITVWIDQAERRGPDRGPIEARQLLDPLAWVDLLKSYVVLDQVVRDQRLFLGVQSPADIAALAAFQVAEQYQPGKYRVTVDGTGHAYTLTRANGVDLERGTVGDSIGTKLGFRWAPDTSVLAPRRSLEFGVATVRDAARGLGEALDMHADPEGNFLTVQLRGPSPTRITAVLNAIGERYVRVAAELKRRRLDELTNILSEQVQTAQHNLREAEALFERFRVQTITLPSDRGVSGVTGTAAAGDPVFSSFFYTKLEREQIANDRETLERLLAQTPDSGLSAEALEGLGSVQHSAALSEALKELTSKQADLRALRYRYSNAAPPVQRVAAAIAALERVTLPGLVRTLVAELAQRETALGQRLDATSRSLRQVPPRVIEAARLRRKVSLAETVYTMLAQRYEEARLAEASTFPDVRILDAAVVPQRPVKDTAPRLILCALVASFGISAVGAILLDRIDPRVRYPQQVSRDMGLMILGALPHVPNGGRDNGRKRKPAELAALVEAFRGVCFNLAHAYGTAGPLIVTITSPGAGDGKSFLAANLALSFAEGGRRTLLIDGDIRRGVLHRRLGVRRLPGLSDVLQGAVPLATVTQKTRYPSLALIGCGTRTSTAPELLGSPATPRLLSEVRSTYDVILLDSPPLSAGVDSFVLGTLTGNLLLVLRAGYSHRELTTAKLEMLHRLPVRLLGAVLNDVRDEAGNRYYYSYYSYYLPGYEALDEQTAVALPVT